MSRRLLPAALLGSVLAALPAFAGSRVPAVASYRIEATYDAEHRVTGKETVTFVNRTHHAFTDLALHLYLNGFRNDRSTWLSEEAMGGGRDRHRIETEDGFGYSEINRIVLSDGTDLTQQVRPIAPDDGNVEDRTLVSIALPTPVQPGETLVFDLDFRAKLPRAIARTGWKDDFVLAAQWFPKLCVATENGWNAHQFHAATEFFADFGDYDVTLSVPKEMKGRIGGSGVLREETELPGGLVRAHFVAEDVHDFAWTASPRFEVYRDTFARPGFANVEILLLLQPDHRPVKERYLRAVKTALESYGTWYVPYPYAALTVVDPPWGSNAGGMEYPTFITGGAPWLAPSRAHQPESVTVHEFGHQIFYGLLASNEFEEAHLDEGFNTYATGRTLKKYFGENTLVKRFFGIPIAFRSVPLPYPEASDGRYLNWQVASRSDPMTPQPTFRDLDGTAVRMNAYSKPALTLWSAERTLGEETWSRVMKTYATRFAFRHPTSEDFRNVVREVAGPTADQLFEETWASSSTIDYAVTKAETRKATPPAGYVGDGPEMKFTPKGEASRPIYESVVVVRRFGEAVWPTEVELRFEGGQRIRRRWDGKDRWIRYRTTGPKLVAALVDPSMKDLLDVNVLNNGLTTKPNPAPANRWSFRLRFWAQNILELFSLLAGC